MNYGSVSPGAPYTLPSGGGSVAPTASGFSRFGPGFQGASGMPPPGNPAATYAANAAGGGGNSYGTAPAAGGNPLNPTYSNVNVSPAASIGLFQQGMAPGLWDANRNAMQAASASGLSGGPLDEVVANANARYLASQDPTLAGIIQNAQALSLGQGEFNAGASNTAGSEQAYYNNQAGQNNQNSIWGLLSGLGGLGGMFGL